MCTYSVWSMISSQRNVGIAVSDGPIKSRLDYEFVTVIGEQLNPYLQMENDFPLCIIGTLRLVGASINCKQY